MKSVLSTDVVNEKRYGNVIYKVWKGFNQNYICTDNVIHINADMRLKSEFNDILKVENY